MEIISYVGFSCYGSTSSAATKKIRPTFPLHIPNLKKTRTKKYHAPNIARSSYTQSKTQFSTQSQINIKSVAKFCGRHTWFLWSVCFCIASIFASYSLITFLKNHTGPINLRFSEDTLEIETLNEIMASFALEENIDSETGEILGIESASKESAFHSAVTFQEYTVKNGDTISGISRRFGLSNLSTLIGVNNINNASGIMVGQKLTIPSLDGLVYAVKEGNTLSSIATEYKVPIEDLLDANDLSSETLSVGQRIFIPGATLTSDKLKAALGTLFANPLPKVYRITSLFGSRADPFTGAKSQHTGIDLACSTGTSVRATMAGTVAFAGYSNVFGNYIIINHGNGYQSLYAHLSKTIAQRGRRVAQGEQIGLVGSTGYSTGPHLHFTVYKNGSLINPSSLIKF